MMINTITHVYAFLYRGERVIAPQPRTRGSLLFIMQYLERAHYLNQRLQMSLRN